MSDVGHLHPAAFHRPRARKLDKRFFGVVSALVVDVVDPAKQGRVKIRFPWFDDDMVTAFCRVRQLYAGKGYGTFFIPEVNDEVLVAFIHGDMRYPIILGGLYNGKDKPPTDRQKDKDQKLIRTKAGHQLLFDDSSKERRVKITTAGGHELDLDDSSGTVTLKTSGGQTITLEGSSSTITIKATNVALQATTVALQSGQVELCDGATEPVILGSTFASYFAGHVHTSAVSGSPTSPPTLPMPPAALSTKVMAG
jgi:uncharacterized protein involved in type VI secretion and phage assembly